VNNAQKEHFDLGLARRVNERRSNADYLVFNLADMINMAATAVSSKFDELQVSGMMLASDIIQVKPDLEYNSKSQQIFLEICNVHGS
jgi:hypothetical protein